MTAAMAEPGIASVTTLPIARGPAPIAPLQGTLALTLSGDDWAQRAPTAADRAAVERLLPRLCTVLVEVLSGDRGIHQLLRWTSAGVYADVSRRMSALHATAARDQRARRLRTQVRSVHVSWPTEQAVEVSVHFRHGQRSRALAARIELLDGRWLCSELQVG